MKNVAPDESAKIETELIIFVAELQTAVQQYISQVPLRTVHKHKGQIFCGQNKYCGKVWRNWALFDWGDDGHLPTKIWGFVDLRDIPDKKLSCLRTCLSKKASTLW